MPGIRAGRERPSTHSREAQLLALVERLRRSARARGVEVAALAASAAGSPPAETKTATFLHQFGRLRRQPVVLTDRPAVFDHHVLALDEAAFVQAPAERGESYGIIGRSEAKKANHRHGRVLRARRERPRRRAAEQRDDLAPM